MVLMRSSRLRLHSCAATPQVHLLRHTAVQSAASQRRSPPVQSASVSAVRRNGSLSRCDAPVPAQRRKALRGAITTKAQLSEAGDTPPNDSADDEPEAVVLLVACGIGLCTGGGVVLFNWAIHAIQEIAWGPVLLSQGGEWARSMPKDGLWPLIIAPPAIGGILVSLLQLAFGEFDAPPQTARSAVRQLSRSEAELGTAKQAATQAVDPGVPAPQSQQGSSLVLLNWVAPLQRMRDTLQQVAKPLVKTIAAAVSLGTGASLGPEGPSVEIGKAFANGLGSTLRSRPKHMLSLMAAGSGAGVAAGFNAPISGVFFAVETVLRRQPGPDGDNADDSGVTVAMVLLASVLAAVVSQAGLGSAPAFRVPDYTLTTPFELPLFVVFGILCGGVSAVSTYSIEVSTAAFTAVKRTGFSSAGLPILGGLATGCFAVLFPEVLYQGFNNVNAVLKGGSDYAAVLLVQILIAKILVTSLCRGSGLVGGIYAPSVFMGATLGSAFGLVSADIAHSLGVTVAEPQVYALVGVAAMLAANCRVPLTSVLLLFELTRDYYIIVPSLLSVGLSFWAVQYALRGLSFMASYTPDYLADARSDEGPPFEVLSRLPLLGIASILSSVEGAAEGGDTTPTAAEPDSQQRHISATLDSPIPEVMEAHPLAVRDVSVQCALEDSCLVFFNDTSMSDALAAFDDTGKTVGMVQGDNGEVLGVLTRDSVVRALKDQLP